MEDKNINHVKYTYLTYNLPKLTVAITGSIVQGLL